MSDKFSKETRSRIMSSIRYKDTKPEMAIRRILWSMGKRYRIHDKSVFGRPDISVKKNKVAVFIDGCFWHGCSVCYKTPKTNTVFWKNKISSNKIRRRRVASILQSDGWTVLEFWEHRIKKEPHKISAEIARVL